MPLFDSQRGRGCDLLLEARTLAGVWGRRMADGVGSKAGPMAPRSTALAGAQLAARQLNCESVFRGVLSYGRALGGAGDDAAMLLYFMIIVIIYFFAAFAVGQEWPRV